MGADNTYGEEHFNPDKQTKTKIKKSIDAIEFGKYLLTRNLHFLMIEKNVQVFAESKIGGKRFTVEELYIDYIKWLYSE